MIKLSLFTAYLAVALLSVSPAAFAAETTRVKPTAKDKTTTGTAKSGKVLNNKNCPVSGHASGSMQKGSFVEYKGYKIGLCCDGCKEEFMKNPDAYLEKAKKNQ